MGHEALSYAQVVAAVERMTEEQLANLYQTTVDDLEHIDLEMEPYRVRQRAVERTQRAIARERERRGLA